MGLTTDLTLPEYWNNRYDVATEPENPSHEWFRSFEELRMLLEKELPGPSLRPRILHLGCGDSTLPADLANLNYDNQLSVDFSAIVIKKMQHRYPFLEWRVDDVRDLHLEDCSVDVAIDKVICPMVEEI
ncbi:MAG: hypothetical protein Q9223_003363 [Gallowayella weberi]